MSRRAVTLVEILIAFFILSLISGSLYYLLHSASYRQSLVACRDEAKRETEKIFALVQSDFQQAMLNSFERVNDNRIKIDVRTQREPDQGETLEYIFTKPFLRRRLANTEWLVSENVSEFDLRTQPETPGHLVVRIESSVAFDSVRPEDAQKNRISQVVIMREDASFGQDPHWRDTGAVSSFFQTQGSLLAGVKENAQRLFEDISAEFSELNADLQEMTVGQIQQMGDQIRGALNNVDTKMLELDETIADIDNEAIFNFGSSVVGRRLRRGRLNRKAREIKDAFAEMQNKNDMDWGRIVRIAGTDMGRLRDTTSELYNAKQEFFDAGHEIVSTMQSFGLDTSGIDFAKWGL